jgi:hypothetical protein
MDIKEIEQFLIWEFFDTCKKSGYADIQDTAIENWQIAAESSYNRYKFFVDSSDKFYNVVQSKLQSKSYYTKRKRVLFHSLKYPAIILGTKQYHSTGLIVGGIADRLFALKHFMRYIITNDIYKYVSDYLKTMNGEYLYRLIKLFEEKLRCIKPDYIILWNDSLLTERAIVLASKKLGITTIDIQDGIYQSTSSLVGGKVADYVLVWGQYFKDLYVENGIRRPEDVFVLGYPYPIEKDEKGYGKKKGCVVCYLGQNYEKYNRNLLEIKISTVRRLNEICTKLGMKFIYRPHPGDDIKMLKDKLPEVEFTQKGEKMIETFRKCDVFISFNSTALIEAAMRSKICLQLIDYPLQTDNFEELGVCDKSFKEIEALEEYLKTIVTIHYLDKFKPKFNNNYIDISHNPAKRFLEILDDICEKEKR